LSGEKRVKDWVSDKLIPILNNGTSDFIGLYFRKSPTVPEIAILLAGIIGEGEVRSVFYVADSFPDFPEMLYSSDG